MVPNDFHIGKVSLLSYSQVTDLLVNLEGASFCILRKFKVNHLSYNRWKSFENMTHIF